MVGLKSQVEDKAATKWKNTHYQAKAIQFINLQVIQDCFANLLYIHFFLHHLFIWTLAEYTIYKHMSEEMLEILTGEDIPFYINLFIAKSTMNLVNW